MLPFPARNNSVALAAVLCVVIYFILRVEHRRPPL